MQQRPTYQLPVKSSATADPPRKPVQDASNPPSKESVDETAAAVSSLFGDSKDSEAASGLLKVPDSNASIRKISSELPKSKQKSPKRKEKKLSESSDSSDNKTAIPSTANVIKSSSSMSTHQDKKQVAVSPTKSKKDKVVDDDDDGIILPSIIAPAVPLTQPQHKPAVVPVATTKASPTSNISQFLGNFPHPQQTQKKENKPQHQKPFTPYLEVS